MWKGVEATCHEYLCRVWPEENCSIRRYIARERCVKCRHTFPIRSWLMAMLHTHTEWRSLVYVRPIFCFKIEQVKVWKQVLWIKDELVSLLSVPVWKKPTPLTHPATVDYNTNDFAHRAKLPKIFAEWGKFILIFSNPPRHWFQDRVRSLSIQPLLFKTA